MFDRSSIVGRLKGRSKSFWIVAALVLFLVIVSAVTSGLGGIFMMLGLIALITGIFALVTKRKTWISLPHPKSARMLAGAGVVALFAGAGIAGATAAPSAPVVKPALVASPPTSTATATATPTPTATNPVRTSCLAAAATQTYQGNALVCTPGDDGRLLWLPEAESKRVVKAAEEKKAAEDKAAADKLAAEKVIADNAAAAKAAADQAAAAQAAADKVAADKAAAAKAVPAPAPYVPPAPAAAYYANCTAVKAAGAAPIHAGQPGYSRSLDRDGDGIACEK